MNQKITVKELKKLKKRFDAEDWSDYEFIQWWSRNHGIGYKLEIIYG